jgi:hypothetical protein
VSGTVSLMLTSAEGTRQLRRLRFQAAFHPQSLGDRQTLASLEQAN